LDIVKIPEIGMVELEFADVPCSSAENIQSIRSSSPSSNDLKSISGLPTVKSLFQPTILPDLARQICFNYVPVAKINYEQLLRDEFSTAEEIRVMTQLEHEIHTLKDRISKLENTLAEHRKQNSAMLEEQRKQNSAMLEEQRKKNSAMLEEHRKNSAMLEEYRKQSSAIMEEHRKQFREPTVDEEGFEE
jgi:TolA-binding protein